jgi:hypothetical protein
MSFNRSSNRSFIIKANGEIIAALPDDEEFSLQQIRDHVAGSPEVICETRDGFFLFQNKEGVAKELPTNELATSMYINSAQRARSVVGRVLLAHPDHIPSYWKR